MRRFFRRLWWRLRVPVDMNLLQLATLSAAVGYVFRHSDEWTAWTLLILVICVVDRIFPTTNRSKPK